MKKLKGFYHNNRIYCILMGISLLCLLLIAAAFLMFFVDQTKTDVYGNRLNGIENVEISKTHKDEVISFITEQEIVDKANINIKGKIIYINVYLKSGKVDDAQSLAVKILEKFSEDEKNFYDINYTFALTTTEEESPFPIMGYKKSDKTIITWTKVNGD